jgi:hypothetical protein
MRKSKPVDTADACWDKDLAGVTSLVTQVPPKLQDVRRATVLDLKRRLGPANTIKEPSACGCRE